MKVSRSALNSVLVAAPDGELEPRAGGISASGLILPASSIETSPLARTPMSVFDIRGWVVTRA